MKPIQDCRAQDGGGNAITQDQSGVGYDERPKEGLNGSRDDGRDKERDDHLDPIGQGRRQASRHATHRKTGDQDGLQGCGGTQKQFNPRPPAARLASGDPAKEGVDPEHDAQHDAEIAPVGHWLADGEGRRKAARALEARTDRSRSRWLGDPLWWLLYTFVFRVNRLHPAFPRSAPPARTGQSGHAPV